MRTPYASMISLKNKTFPFDYEETYDCKSVKIHSLRLHKCYPAVTLKIYAELLLHSSGHLSGLKSN